MQNHLEIRNLHVEIEGKEIISGLDLVIPRGEVHAVMGPNGSGKSTLANVMMGNPRYEVTNGDILFEGRSLLEMSADERARAGLFLSFQYPVELPGIPLNRLIRKASSSVLGPEAYRSPKVFDASMKEACSSVGVTEEVVSRPTNEGFSGGEKKKAEVLQIEMLKPRFVILDEVDSGLDIDALNGVADVINRMRNRNRSFLIITHYQRILSLVTPDRVHVMKDGRIIRSGGASLVKELEQAGYANMEAA
jgi:Fe-S cluster assembly ATP-binding protein